MNVTGHEVAQSLVNKPVTLDSTQSVEFVRHDCNLEVPFSFPGSGMAGMQMALILDEYLVGGERPVQQALYLGAAVRCHGRTRLKGFTMEERYTPAST